MRKYAIQCMLFLNVLLLWNCFYNLGCIIWLMMGPFGFSFIFDLKKKKEPYIKFWLNVFL